MKREGESRKATGKVFEVGVRSRGKNTGILGQRGASEGKK